MQFPCEILVRNILPAIKAIIVKELNTKYNKSQKEIASLLGITQPSVSYYLHGERGGKTINLIKETKKIYDTILELAAKLVDSNITTQDLLKEICSICLEIRPIFIEKVCPEKFKFLKDWNVCFAEQ
ncbi:MAG: transcriptional regulator [Candidatus Helarchaeota archaeon]